MAISGTYVDFRNPEISAHALHRFYERIVPSPNAEQELRRAWSKAYPIYSQPWWTEGLTSYWFSKVHDVLFIVACESRRLVIVTCVTMEMAKGLGNPKVAAAVKQVQTGRRTSAMGK